MKTIAASSERETKPSFAQPVWPTSGGNLKTPAPSDPKSSTGSCASLRDYT
jgi:hypothetical protein